MSLKKGLQFILVLSTAWALGACESYEIGDSTNSSQSGCAFPLDPIEPIPDIPGRTYPSSCQVSLADNWQEGSTHSVGGYPGTRRMLVVIVGLEVNTGSYDVTAVSFGNQAMSQVTEIEENSGWSTRTEMWVLDEDGIQAATSSTINVTTAGAGTINTTYLAHVVLANVDQTTPISSVTTNSASSTTVSTIVTGTEGGLNILGSTHGSPPGPFSITSAGWTTGSSQDDVNQSTFLTGSMETTDTSPSTATVTHGTSFRVTILAANFQPPQ